MRGLRGVSIQAGRCRPLNSPLPEFLQGPHQAQLHCCVENCHYPFVVGLLETHQVVPSGQNHGAVTTKSISEGTGGLVQQVFERSLSFLVTKLSNR
jgi:hypothetical protein